LIFTAAALCAPAAARQPLLAQQPAQLSFFGMNTYFTGLERNSRDGDDGVAALVGLGRNAGVAWAREELSWANLERSGKGQWQWSGFDRRLLQAAQAGYGIVGMLLTTPAWARVADCAARTQRYAAYGVHAQDYWCPPATMQDYADYVYQTVERYDGDGYADAPGSPRVAAWQLWNEPNAWETWPGSPAEYAALLQAGYAAAKAADGGAIVASAGVYIFDGGWSDGRGHSDGLRFLDAALAAAPGAWAAFDALAIHPYLPDVAPDQPGIVAQVTLWGRISTARNWLLARAAAYHTAPKALWISEIGWSTCSAGQSDCYAAQSSREPDSLDAERWPMVERPSPLGAGIAGLIGKDEQQQANYLLRAHAIALALGVQHLSYFQLEDKFDGSARNFWEEAAILRTKAQGYGAKPAYAAYHTLAEQLAGAHFVGLGALHTYSYNPAAQRNPAARYHMRFRTPDNVLIDLLWQSTGAETLTLLLDPGRSVMLVTRDGVQVPPAVQAGVATIAVGEQPFYLRQTAPAALSVQPQSLALLIEPGSAPQTLPLTIANSGSGNLTWSAIVNADWLRLGATTGEGWSSTAPLTVDPAGLLPGEYSGAINVASSAGSQQIEVRLRIVERVWRLNMPLAGR
jgi:hypothetical protein